jgi:hypothetical protein
MTRARRRSELSYKRVYQGGFGRPFCSRLSLRQKPLERAPALGRDPDPAAVFLDKAGLLKPLKGDPVQLASVKLAFRDVAESNPSDGLRRIAS